MPRRSVPAEAKTAHDIVASAHLFHSADLVAKAAEVLGAKKAAARYARLAEKVRQAWLHEYVTGRAASCPTPRPRTRWRSSSASPPTRTCSLPWATGLRGWCAVTRIASARGSWGRRSCRTPSLGTGHPDIAARLLLQTEVPSWLYPVTMGATTVWERWDSMLPDGTVNPGEMTSFNHYAFGAIADWLHRVVAGLAPGSAPATRPSGSRQPSWTGWSRAAAQFDSPYGPASSRWELAGDELVVTAIVPPNATASVELPGADPIEVGSGSHRWVVSYSRDPQPSGSVSTQTSLAALIDDAEAYEAVWRAMAERRSEAGERVP